MTGDVILERIKELKKEQEKIGAEVNQIDQQIAELNMRKGKAIETFLQNKGAIQELEKLANA